MLTILAERPWVLTILGVAGVALGILGAARTGARGPLWFSLACGLLTPIAVAAERWWVTPREEVGAFLDKLAGDLQANRDQEVLSAIADDEVVRQARAELDRYTFTEAKILSVRDFELHDESAPAEAVVTFHAMVRVDMSGGIYRNDRAYRSVRLWLRRDADGWRVTHYEHFPIGQRGPAPQGPNTL
jgi:hypothetical protein